MVGIHHVRSTLCANTTVASADGLHKYAHTPIPTPIPPHPTPPPSTGSVPHLLIVVGEAHPQTALKDALGGLGSVELGPESQDEGRARMATTATPTHAQQHKLHSTTKVHCSTTTKVHIAQRWHHGGYALGPHLGIHDQVVGTVLVVDGSDGWAVGHLSHAAQHSRNRSLLTARGMYHGSEASSSPRSSQSAVAVHTHLLRQVLRERPILVPPRTCERLSDDRVKRLLDSLQEERSNMRGEWGFTMHSSHYHTPIVHRHQGQYGEVSQMSHSYLYRTAMQCNALHYTQIHTRWTNMDSTVEHSLHTLQPHT
jgi:hypothetical protein